MKKLKIIKKIMKDTCWVCKGAKCKACHYTGQWEESIYYHIYKGMAFGCDTIKLEKIK